MGVAGLWDVIRPVGKTRSLTELSVTEGFEANLNGARGFRIGIDASIWFFHAEYGKEGENPVLRTLFFRCATLMHSPFLPLFVFDGPKRPEWKRGKKVNRTSHKLIPGMKTIVESFGFEWRTAPGEAEAELAYLNRIGLIDGVLSDDVDNFLFGATTVIRNPSNNLSGNRSNPVLNAAGKDDKNHTKVYRLSEIVDHPDIRLTRGGMILIGLMSGGDYHQGGLKKCGTKIAHGLAKCGFGDTLFQAAQSKTREQLKTFLIAWRHELCHELRTNSQGNIGTKHPSLANSVTSDFPDIDVLLSYTNPITSESMGSPAEKLTLTWSKEPDLGKLAATCEFYFEWGYREAIIKRFRTIIWHSAVLRILRRAVLDLDKKAHETLPPATPKKSGKPVREAIGTPSKMIAKHFSSLKVDDGTVSEDDDGERLIIKICSERRHISTDEILEYRLEIAPAQLVRLAESGIKGIRSPEGPDEWVDQDDEDDDRASKKPPPDPESHMRVWMPACMVRLVEPRLVEEYEAVQEAKRVKKAKKGRGKNTKAANTNDNISRPDDPSVAPRRKVISESRANETPQYVMSDDLGLETGETGPSKLQVAQNPMKRITGARKTDFKMSFTSIKTTAISKAKVSAPACILSAAEYSTTVSGATSADEAYGPVEPKSIHPSFTISNPSLSSKAAVVRDLTKKKSVLKDPSKTQVFDVFQSSKPSAVVSSSKPKTFFNVSSDEEPDTPLNYQSMLASPMRPNRLAAWSKTLSKTYVSLSDSDDDDACECKPPLGFNDTFPYASGDSFGAPHSTASKGSRKTHASTSSISDSGKLTSNKFSRKSKEYISPHKGDAIVENKAKRPCSPSPVKMAKKVDGLGVQESIIDISDSDDELPPPPRFQEPPLMRARARAHAKIDGKQKSLDDFVRQFEKQRPEKTTRNLECDDIIDLT